MRVIADIFNEHISDDFFKLLLMGGGMFIAFVAIVTGGIRRIVRTKAREQTKRELAAYVAEGSMKPEDAERIIMADVPRWERCG